MTAKTQQPTIAEEEAPNVATLHTLAKDNVAKIAALIESSIISGNKSDVKKIRKCIEEIGKMHGEMRKSFDDALLAGRSGYNGTDFLSGIEPIRKPRKDSDEKVKPKSIFASTAIFDEDDE
jgi:hypothetical protein